MIEEFKPHPLLSSGLTQTIVCSFLPPGKKSPPTQQHIIPLEDGDRLVITENRPKTWTPGDRIVVLIHGLAGSEESPYIIRLGRKFYNMGYLVIKVNLRSCGPGMGLARQPYHSGRSEDTRAILNWLKFTFPTSPVTQIGFSLSANITLKMLGEDGKNTTGNLDSAVAVSPPFDLNQSAQMILSSPFRVFDRYFLRRLIRHVREVEQHFPDLPVAEFPNKMSILDFDHIYTSRRSGYLDAYDYYEKCSCAQFVEGIDTKCLVLYAKDDPVVSLNGIEKHQLPEKIDAIVSDKGGHVGFLGKDGFWMDNVILDWVQQHDRLNT